MSILFKLKDKRVQEAALTIGGKLLSIVIILAATKILTTYLNVEDYGLLALYNISATLPSIVIFGPLGQGVLRLFSYANDKNESGLFFKNYATLFRYASITTGAIGVILAIAFLSFNQKNWALFSIVAALLNILNGYNTISYGLLNAQRKRMRALGLETTDRLFQQAFAIALVILFQNAIWVIIGQLLSSIVFYLINRNANKDNFSLATTTPVIEKTPYGKRILHYSWPFLAFGGIQWSQNASERWVLDIVESKQELALYALLNQIGFQSLSLLFGSLSYYIWPIIFNRAGSLQNKNQFDSANRLNNYFLLFNTAVTLVIALLLIPLGEWIILILSNADYTSVAPYLPLMAMAGGIFNIAQNYANRFMLSLQTQLLIFPKVFAGLFGIATNLWAVHAMGLKGLVFAILGTQIVYLASLMTIWKWYGKTQLSA